jgi:hypothetical protein
MLAKAVALIGVISSSLVIAVSTSFRHQLRPHLFYLFNAQRKVLDLVVNMLRDLRGQLAQKSLLIDLLRPPVPLLRRYVSGRRDSNGKINEEESQDLAMAKFGCVGELERLHAVLQDVGED